MTTTEVRRFPFIEEGTIQTYEMHRLCNWGVIDSEEHDFRCTCPRLIHVVDQIGQDLAHINYWILEPTATDYQVSATRCWCSGDTVIVGGVIWNEALAQC